MSAHDPWSDRLTEYLDGELAAEERAGLEKHLAGCASCTTLLADLGRIVREARALDERGPERDLWPGVERALAGRAVARRFPRWLLAFAAGVLVTLAAIRLFADGGEGGELVARGAESYLLLLHEPADAPQAEDDPAAHRDVVERYARWARELGARCSGGEELAEGGLELRPCAGGPAVSPRPAGEHVGGYFLLEVRDEGEALALARTCPHLEGGGWIELRRIRAH